MMFKTARYGLATAVAALPWVATARAAADQTHVAYTVAAGAQSPAISIPVPNLPVAMLCANRAPGGDEGVGNASIIRATTIGYLIWTAYDIPSKAISADTNFSSAIKHIVYCDFGAVVEIQSLNGSQIQINNKGTIAASVDVMFVY